MYIINKQSQRGDMVAVIPGDLLAVDMFPYGLKKHCVLSQCDTLMGNCSDRKKVIRVSISLMAVTLASLSLST